MPQAFPETGSPIAVGARGGARLLEHLGLGPFGIAEVSVAEIAQRRRVGVCPPGSPVSMTLRDGAQTVDPA